MLLVQTHFCEQAIVVVFFVVSLKQIIKILAIDFWILHVHEWKWALIFCGRMFFWRRFREGCSDGFFVEIRNDVVCFTTFFGEHQSTWTACWWGLKPGRSFSVTKHSNGRCQRGDVVKKSTHENESRKFNFSKCFE